MGRLAFHKGIARQLILHILLFSLLVTVLTTVIQVHLRYIDDVENLEKRLYLIELSYIESLTSSLWDMYQAQLETQLEGMLLFPDIQYLEVRSKNKIIVSAGTQLTEGTISISFPMVHNQQDEAIQIGELLIVASLENLLFHAQEQAIVLLTTNAINTFLVSIFLFFIFQYFVTRHLVQISQHTRYLTAEDLETVLKLDRPKRDDELQHMMTAINEMKINLKNSYQILQEELEYRKQIEENLRISQIEAETANRSKTEFLANMSHEIRSPLNAILGFSRILLNRLHNFSLPREFQQYLQTIQTSGNNLAELINNILDLSKIDAGKVTLSEEPVNLKLLIQSMYHINKAYAMEKGIIWQYDISPDVPEVAIFDRTKLNQILMNLLSNAIKFTPEDKEVRLHVFRNGDFILIQIQDQGIGIAEERQQSIFEPFEQADGTTTRRFGGTGLGLTITKQLVELMGGTILVESALGEGSTFSIQIPLKESSEQITEQNPINLQDLHFERNNQILVVEDNPNNQEVLRAWFKDLDIDIHLANNGLAGVEQALKFKMDGNLPDLILMDIHMPEMDGLTATKQIRLHPEYTNVPIVALSADAFSEQQKVAHAVGLNDYLTKPIDFQKLLLILTKYLRQERYGAQGSSAVHSQQSDDESSPQPSSLPEPIEKQLLEKFVVLSQIPLFDGAEIVDQIGHMLSICNNYNSPYSEILRKLEDAVFKSQDEQFQQLIKEVLNDNNPHR